MVGIVKDAKKHIFDTLGGLFPNITTDYGEFAFAKCIPDAPELR